jgi:REP element-mobilizing transposase RayT
MNRGDHFERIYQDNRDRQKWLEVLAEVCVRSGWWIHSYVLMPNHYHLLVETPRGNLVKGMQWLNSTYTLRYNSRHQLRGHLFQGRYKAILIEDDTDYFLTVSDYIHLNPLRAKLLRHKEGESLFEGFWKYRWNSAHVFGRETGECPKWLKWEKIFGCFGLEEDSSRSRKMYRRRLEEGWGKEFGQDGGQSLGIEIDRRESMG